jgi:hypothetical protein
MANDDLLFERRAAGGAARERGRAASCSTIGSVDLAALTLPKYRALIILGGWRNA